MKYTTTRSSVPGKVNCGGEGSKFDDFFDSNKLHKSLTFPLTESKEELGTFFRELVRSREGERKGFLVKSVVKDRLKIEGLVVLLGFEGMS